VPARDQRVASSEDGTTATTVSNTTEGAWLLARQLEGTIGGSGGSDGS
jgi:hypothetical protein